MKEETLFYEYYENWIKIYKEGAVRDVTLDKYKLTLKWIKKLEPDLKIGDVDRMAYQGILNKYAATHEKQTVIDFHHQLKGAILDAVDEGLIERDPTRRIVIKGKAPSKKKDKYLNQFELQSLINDLNLEEKLNYDWLILLIAKTGMRFSEALGVTPNDFDFKYQTLSVNKTWDYKKNSGFVPTKNKSSNRKIKLDWQTATQFSGLVKGLPPNDPIFIFGKDKKIFSTTVNDILERHCRNAGITVISVHGLRHTHASLLLFGGASIASVSKRLGHSNMATTQKVYLHVIKELENQDTDIIMRQLSSIG
jgi:integrase